MSDLFVEFYDAEKMIPSPAEAQWCIIKYYRSEDDHEPFFTKALHTIDGWKFMEETNPMPKKITHWAFLFDG